MRRYEEWMGEDKAQGWVTIRHKPTVEKEKIKAGAWVCGNGAHLYGCSG
jgi:hypothetical protein